MTTPASALPVGSRDRIGLLDALRGFALFGILFVNMTWFTGYALRGPEGRPPLSTEAVDNVVSWIISFAVEGKFWSIFALLFGAGFAIQVQRFQETGRNAVRILLRRYAVLFIIGLAHAVFIWFGDIVSLYAVAGFALLLFRRMTDRGLLAWAIAMLAYPILHAWAWLGVHTWAGSGNEASGYGPLALLPGFSEGNYAEAFRANKAFLTERWFLAVYEARFAKLLGMFLLGYLAARRGLFANPDRHLPLIWRIYIITLLIGIPANIAYANYIKDYPLQPPPSVNGSLFASLATAAVPVLSMAYTCAFVIAFQGRWGRRLQRMFSAVGRAALTNYVMQSVFGVVVFYGYGGGAWGALGCTASLPLIAALFCSQAMLSSLWLSRFSFGPIEWLWRSATYWKRLPLRRQPAPA